jgi:putative ABC transport system substrate-binding protein
VSAAGSRVDLALDVRYAENRYDRLPALARELIVRNPDVIFAVASPAIQALTKATTTVPIVIETLGDAVSAGLVGDIARPGSNVTGVSGFAPELSTKRLQLIREILPAADTVAVLANLSNPTTPPVVHATEGAGRQLRIQTHVVDVRATGEVAGALDTMVRRHADAVVVVSDPMLNSQTREIVDLAARHRLPAVYEQRSFPEVGGLMSYGPGRVDRFRRAAIYVDRILRGAKPAELPVERPTNFELVVNRAAAKGLGLTIPPSVLLRADAVLD